MIVVFGSLNADFVFPVSALPREGDTVACEAVVLMPGGKGANQAVAVVPTIPQRGVYPALRGARVAADWVNLR